MPNLSQSTGRMYEDVIDPTVNDDGQAGYEVGNWWLNTLTNSLFQCLGINTGAAIWQLKPSEVNGTWTPALVFGGDSTGITYNNVEGLYTRIGSTVYINAFLQLTSKGTSQGNAAIQGLPFTARSGITPKGLKTIRNEIAISELYSNLYGRINAASSQINLIETSDILLTNIKNATDVNFSDDSIIQVDGFYFI